MDENSIPAYAMGVTRSGSDEKGMRITSLHLQARAETPSSRPSRDRSRRVGVSVSVDRSGSVVIRPDRMSRIVFEPGALQSALADLRADEYETPLHELVALCREQNLALDISLYGSDEQALGDDTHSAYHSGARLTGHKGDPMDVIRDGVYKLRAEGSR
jgi:hypothetical protein